MNSVPIGRFAGINLTPDCTTLGWFTEHTGSTGFKDCANWMKNNAILAWRIVMKLVQSAFLLLLLSAGTVLCNGCSKTLEYGDPVISIAGTVTDQQTKTLLDSAWGSLGDSSQVSRRYTDTSGAFGILTVPFKSQRLYAGKDGYLTFDSLLEDVSASIIDLHIELRPSLQGSLDSSEGGKV
jgi:hypothetical protein